MYVSLRMPSCRFRARWERVGKVARVVRMSEGW